MASLAYNFVLASLMLAEATFECDRLGLPERLPIKIEDLARVSVYDHRVCGYMGVIETQHYSFSFGMSGRLSYITKLTEPGGISLEAYQRSLSSTNVTITTNDAYRIATNCLRKLDVSVVQLEKEQPEVTEFRIPGGMDGNPPVPIYWLDWGTTPAVQVLLSAVSGDILWIRQEDESYSSRPAPLVRNVDKLLSIPDAEFLKYTPEQRSNLITEFSAVRYPSETNLGKHPFTTNTSPHPESIKRPEGLKHWGQLHTFNN